MRYSDFYSGGEGHHVQDDDEDLFPYIVEDSVDPSIVLPVVGDPVERMRRLEGMVSLLASRLTSLRAALRAMVTYTYSYSDRGTAPWYRMAIDALRNADELNEHIKDGSDG